MYNTKYSRISIKIKRNFNYNIIYIFSYKFNYSQHCLFSIRVIVLNYRRTIKHPNLVYMQNSDHQTTVSREMYRASFPEISRNFPIYGQRNTTLKRSHIKLMRLRWPLAYSKENGTIVLKQMPIPNTNFVVVSDPTHCALRLLSTCISW